MARTQRPQAPHLPAQLLPCDTPLGDDSSWEGLDVAADCVVEAGADRCEITSCHLRGVRFTGVELSRLRLLDVVLDDCELSGAVLSEATFARVELNRCRMSGLVVSGLKGRDLRWSDCKLDGANFRGAAVERSVWSTCILSEADFYGSALSASSFDRCDLSDAEFSKVSCQQVDLRGSTLEGILGANYLGGCVIGSDQVVAVAVPLLAAMGIVVDDDARDEEGPDR